MSIVSASSEASEQKVISFHGGRRLARLLGLFVWILVVAALIALTLPTTRIFERVMVPELTRHAAVLGELIAAEVERAVGGRCPDRPSGRYAGFRGVNRR